MIEKRLLEGRLDLSLPALARAAADIQRGLEAQKPKHGNYLRDVLRGEAALIHRMQVRNSGGLPGVWRGDLAEPVNPWDVHTQQEDSVQARAARGFMWTDAVIQEAGGRMLEVIGDRYLMMAHEVVGNTSATIDALGWLPAMTEAGDPTKPAQGRPFIPLDAADVPAMVGWMNTCVYWFESRGEVLDLWHKLARSLRVIRLLNPGDQIGQYVQLDDAGLRMAAVYGAADGTVSRDPAHGKAGFGWTFDGARVDQQLAMYDENVKGAE